MKCGTLVCMSAHASRFSAKVFLSWDKVEFVLCVDQLTSLVPNWCRMVTASDGMGLPGELWLRGLGDVLLPLVADLNSLLAARPRDFVDVGACLKDFQYGALEKPCTCCPRVSQRHCLAMNQSVHVFAATHLMCGSRCFASYTECCACQSAWCCSLVLLFLQRYWAM